MRPSAEPSAGNETTGAEPAPPQKPLAEMSLVEQLQLQATKLRKPGTTRPSAEPATGSETTGAEPAPPQKPLAEMSLIEQLQ